MKLTRCDKGHFYDAEKCDTCPCCTEGVSLLQQNGAGENAPVNVALPSELSLFNIK